MNRTQKNRMKFLKRMQSISSDLNEHLLNESFYFEIFFTGRDDDFFNMNFTNGTELIKIQIELKNHNYEITGHEKIDCSIKNVESVNIASEKNMKMKKYNLDSSIILFIKNRLL